MRRYIWYFLPVSFLFLIFSSCKKMNYNYKKFVVPGGVIYPGHVKNVVVYPGRYRVKMSWIRGDDQVVKTRIFWNFYTDSTEISLQKEHGDTINIIIDSLSEQPYDFILKSYDAQGYVSIPMEVTCAVYGDNYQSSLIQRSIDLITLFGNDSISVNWGHAAVSNGAFATEIRYIDTTGRKKIKRIPASQPISVISNINPDSGLYYRTLYLPDILSIDTFYTNFEHIEKNIFIDKSAWKVTDYSSVESGDKNKASNIIDGDPSTRWASLTNGSVQLPQYITVDMKRERTITGFEIFRYKGDDRSVDTFQLLVSKDGSNWVDLGSFDFNRFTDDGQFYGITSYPKARYWKFVGLTGPEPFILMGEISVYGY